MYEIIAEGPAWNWNNIKKSMHAKHILPQNYEENWQKISPIYILLVSKDPFDLNNFYLYISMSENYEFILEYRSKYVQQSIPLLTSCLLNSFSTIIHGISNQHNFAYLELVSFVTETIKILDPRNKRIDY